MQALIDNFQWHIHGKIATGGKPSRSIQLAWLIGQGFTAVVSLELVPNDIADAIRAFGRKHLNLEIEDSTGAGFDPKTVDRETWLSFRSFIDAVLSEKGSVFVHCSAGITRSVRMVERYLYERNLESPGPAGRM